MNRMKVKIFTGYTDVGDMANVTSMVEARFFEWSKGSPDISIQTVTHSMMSDKTGNPLFALTVLYEEAAPDARLTLDMLNALDHTMMMFQEVQSGLQPTMSAVAKSMAKLMPLWKKVRRF